MSARWNVSRGGPEWAGGRARKAGGPVASPAGRYNSQTERRITLGRREGAAQDGIIWLKSTAHPQSPRIKAKSSPARKRATSRPLRRCLNNTNGAYILFACG